MAEEEQQNIEDRILSAVAPDLDDSPEEPIDPEPTDEPLEETSDETEGVEAQSDEDAPEEPPGLIEVEFEGQTYEVPENIKDALLRQSDYTQKTQSLAEKRQEIELQSKQIETVRAEQKFIGEIQPELNNIGYLQATIQQIEEDLQKNLSEMSSEDMFRKKIEADGYKSQLNDLSNKLQEKYREFEEAQKQSYQELLEQGAQVLKKAIPGWSESKQQEMRDYALEKGFSQQEVSSIVDPRYVQILWQASQFEALQKKTANAAEKVKAAPTIQPKGRSNQMDDAAKKRLAQNKIRKNSKLSNADKADQMMETILDRIV